MLEYGSMPPLSSPLLFFCFIPLFYHFFRILYFWLGQGVRNRHAEAVRYVSQMFLTSRSRKTGVNLQQLSSLISATSSDMLCLIIHEKDSATSSTYL